MGFTAQKIKRVLAEAVKGDPKERSNLNEDQIRKERAHLQAIVKRDPSLLVDDISKSELPETGEHNIRISNDGRFWKYTKGGVYGYKPDAEAVDIHNVSNLKLTIQPATPKEYLNRLKLSNRLFGDSIIVEGITKSGSLVTSQTAVIGKPATREQIAKALQLTGWEQIDSARTALEGFMKDSSWVHRGEGIVMVDARPANILINDQEEIYPIDVMLIEIDEFLKKALLKAP